MWKGLCEDQVASITFELWGDLNYSNALGGKGQPANSYMQIEAATIIKHHYRIN